MEDQFCEYGPTQEAQWATELEELAEEEKSKSFRNMVADACAKQGAIESAPHEIAHLLKMCHLED